MAQTVMPYSHNQGPNILLELLFTSIIINHQQSTVLLDVALAAIFSTWTHNQTIQFRKSEDIITFVT